MVCDIHTSCPRLPPELFRPIVESLDGHRRTLFALSLCNKYLREDAERELYTVLDESSAADASLHIAFLSTITRTPRLAKLVRVYYSINIVHYREAPLWGLLSRALKLMSGLKVLHFRTFGGHPAGELLVDAPCTLERLYWANHSEGDAMGTVLAQQPQLQYLYLESRRAAVFPPGCAPRLRSLAGNRATIEALLPGRYVRDLAWIPELQDTAFGAGGVPRLETALHNVRTLSYGGYFARPHFGLVVDHLHKLERLELVGLLSEETMLIKRLKALRELVFSFKWGSRYLPIPCDFEARKDLVEDLFSWCPNLMFVDIAHEWTTISEIRYQRWTRDEIGSAPTRISLMDVKCGHGGRAISGCTNTSSMF